MSGLSHNRVDSEDEKSIKDTQVVYERGETQADRSKHESQEHSLIFCSQDDAGGNDQGDYEDQIGKGKGESNTSFLFGGEPTQDDTFGLRNKPDETPFLSKLRDPFEKHDSIIGTPTSTPVDTKARLARPNGPYLLKDVSLGKEKASEGVVAQGNEDSIQSLYSSSPDKPLQGFSDSTQVINTGRTDDFHHSLSNYNDTQVIQRPDAVNVPVVNHNVKDNYEQIDSSPQVLSIKAVGNADYCSSPKTEYDTSLVQIPQTLERLTNSRREVLNTQEAVESSIIQNDTAHFDMNIGQNSFLDQTFEEVKTDDEKEPISRYPQKDAEEILSPEEGDVQETRALPENEVNNLASSKTDHISGTLSDESTRIDTETASNRRVPVLGSPSEIEESSPIAIKKRDILKLKMSSPENERLAQSSSGIGIDHRYRRGKNHISSSPADLEKNRNSNLDVNHHILQSRTPISSNKEFTEDQWDILREERSISLDGRSFTSVSSVWAFFNLKVYSGVIREPRSDFSVVEFDEGSYEIKNSDLYVLDIRIGDKVKLRSSSSNFLVVGLSKSRSQHISCIRGYSNVHVKKISLKGKSKEGELITPLSQCFMDMDDWIYHQQSFKLMFDNQDILKLDGSKQIFDNMIYRDKHPSNGNEVGIGKTKRYIGSPLSSPSKNSKISVSPKKRHKMDVTGRIFSGMLFCITSLDSTKKENLVNIIDSNGGFILDSGFEDVFTCIQNKSHTLLSSSLLDNFTFAALISDTYCRSAKYLQTLALGWPILSEFFIYDSVKESKCLSQWPYLLPAGYSNITKSLMSINVFDFKLNHERGFKLSQQADINGNLLNNFEIIFIKDSVDNTTSDICRFIFHAFGCQSLTTVDNLESTLQHLKSDGVRDKKNLIYDDGFHFRDLLQRDGHTVQTSKSTSRPTSSRHKSKLYKDGNKTFQFGFIDWEWLVQCVISSNLWTPEYISIQI